MPDSLCPAQPDLLKILLEWFYAPSSFFHRLDRPRGGLGAGQSGDDWHAIEHRHGTNLAFVGLRALFRRCVDDELDLIVLDEILDVGPAFAELFNALGFDIVFCK